MRSFSRKIASETVATEACSRRDCGLSPGDWLFDTVGKAMKEGRHWPLDTHFIRPVVAEMHSRPGTKRYRDIALVHFLPVAPSTPVDRAVKDGITVFRLAERGEQGGRFKLPCQQTQLSQTSASLPLNISKETSHSLERARGPANGESRRIGSARTNTRVSSSRT